MDILIEQGLDLIDEIGLAASLLHQNGLIAAADRQLPHKNQQRDDAHRGNTVQQDLVGVVTGHVHKNALCFVPDFLLELIAQRGQQFDPVQAAHLSKQVGEYTGFNGQIAKTQDNLTAGNVGKAHQQAGDPHQGAAIFQSSEQGRILDASALSCLG